METEMGADTEMAEAMKHVMGEGENPEEGLITIKDEGEEAAKAREVYMNELARIVTPAYVATLKGAFPWMEIMTFVRDDKSLDWWLKFERDGKPDRCYLGGSTFPQFADDFIAEVKKYLASQVDRAPMEALSVEFEGWDGDDGDDTVPHKDELSPDGPTEPKDYEDIPF